MTLPQSAPYPKTGIRLRGVRQNNLKNFNLDLPYRKLIVITGLSGSGKSTLAFDTLFAEGQRRYIETFSPYARQFFERMDKPAVDSIEGIPPAIAIEQKNTVKTSRSTVGTMTELCDYFKVLWPNMAQLHCPQCHAPVHQHHAESIWKEWTQAPRPETSEGFYITFDIPLSEKMALKESLQWILQQGYQRVLWEDQAVRIEDWAQALPPAPPCFLTLIQDRLSWKGLRKARFMEACEQAYRLGKNLLTLRHFGSDPASLPAPIKYSSILRCESCSQTFNPATPGLFSFNHPVGACPECKGFGQVKELDLRLVIPNPHLSISAGAIKPWETRVGKESYRDLLTELKKHQINPKIPFNELPPDTQQWIIEGDPDYGTKPSLKWPNRWYGIRGYFRWIKSKSYEMHYRILLHRYQSLSSCPQCKGSRFNPQALNYLLQNPLKDHSHLMRLPDLYAIPIDELIPLIQKWISHPVLAAKPPIRYAFNEVLSRIQYLQEVGLGYLSLDRPSRTLSGGETERVNLTVCLGNRLVNTLFILDEPTVGLHPRDTHRLIQIMRNLRDAGNTVVVVEHETQVMQAADQIVDLGPHQGHLGGELLCQGSFEEILKESRSLTSDYLSGRREIEIPVRRPVPPLPPKGPASQWFHMTHGTAFNLQDISVSFPKNKLIAITGVSGSGKSTLLKTLLWPILNDEINIQNLADPSEAEPEEEASDEPIATDIIPPKLFGHRDFSEAVLIDQSPIHRTSRSTPILYLGGFEAIRTLFASQEKAVSLKMKPGHFSFNHYLHNCPQCKGSGIEKIEMQFLSDILIPCSSCHGKRYPARTLQIKLPIHFPLDTIPHLSPEARAAITQDDNPGLSIADFLDLDAFQALEILQHFLPQQKTLNDAYLPLKILVDIGLGYLRLGQGLHTLSGGECQRLKIAKSLSESLLRQPGKLLFLMDEPTTGLHFEDIRILLKNFHQLIDHGHSIIIVEHNLDLIKCADWVIDLGPDSGPNGGRLVAQGTPESIAQCPESLTGQALRPLLKLTSPA